MLRKSIFILFIITLVSLRAQNSNMINVTSEDTLLLPVLSEANPEAGRRVIQHAEEYNGTQVYHTLYLPGNWDENWKVNGKRYPIIFEYTGNYYEPTGSTGEVENAALGFGLSAGEFIWVVLPYVNEAGKDNEVKWWGDEVATVNYAKTNVPKLIEQYGGEPEAVFLCGFSRGAIGVNYIGLYDDEIAGLWSAFISHDHFDGEKCWVKPWGSPYDSYKAGAIERLKRVDGRPYFVSSNGGMERVKKYIESVQGEQGNFTFQNTLTTDIFKFFPNQWAYHPHNDSWPLLPSKYRVFVWEWMNNVVATSSK